MFRFRIRSVVKLGAIVIAMLLLGPYLFHLKLMENNEEDDAYQLRLWKHQQKLLAEIRAQRAFEKANKHSDETHFGSKEVAVLKNGDKGNFEPPEGDVNTRPGDNGQAIELTENEKQMSHSSLAEFGFNMVASDKMPMDRVVPDMRLPECRFWHYPPNQPTASVILVFHNEGFSTLVRTIYSVIYTSPRELLKEVVLVDDYSDKNHLKQRLSDYITKEFGSIVKLYRNSKREGLIRTRTRGAELATGDVIVFLDAHCECNRNWLVPLLDRIRHNRHTMAVPIVDGIDLNTMEYTTVYGDKHFRGIFEWGFFYKETAVPARELARRKHNSEPYRSPTHAGGLFAMDRNYFFELGGYDPGLKIWGGENYELSFKIWQCGGTVEWVPCSRVGHIYRNHMPYSLGRDIDPNMSPIYINYMRVAEVWMDADFKEYFYTREPSFRGYPFGNITMQLNFKKQHNCKSFRWFMKTVAYDVFFTYPKPPPNKAWGEIRLRGKKLCWDAGSGEVEQGAIGVQHCYGTGNVQQFRLNVKGQIGVGERCILAGKEELLYVDYCQPQPTGPWDWDQVTGFLQHKILNKCVAMTPDKKLHLQYCNTQLDSLKWDILEVYPWKKS